MTYGEGPKTRRKEHLKNARSALDSWRINTYLKDYGSTSLTPEVLLPDKMLTSLASKRAKTVEEIAVLVSTWAFVEEHAADVLRILTRVDDLEREERLRNNRVRKEARKQVRAGARTLTPAEAAQNPRPAKRRGRPPKARPPLATTSANTMVCHIYLHCSSFTYFRKTVAVTRNSACTTDSLCASPHIFRPIHACYPAHTSCACSPSSRLSLPPTVSTADSSTAATFPPDHARAFYVLTLL